MERSLLKPICHAALEAARPALLQLRGPQSTKDTSCGSTIHGVVWLNGKYSVTPYKSCYPSPGRIRIRLGCILQLVGYVPLEFSGLSAPGQSSTDQTVKIVVLRLA